MSPHVGKEPVTHIEARGSIVEPPRWARLERELIELMNGTREPILEQYTAEDGSLLWPPEEYVGIDGHDDAYESFSNWPLFYLVGGEREFLEVSHREFDAIVEQFRNVQTPFGHPMAVDEYEQSRDWFHQGEGNLFFYNLCLADPNDDRVRERAERFAGFYLADAPTGNYDGDRNLVCAPMNGSMGPDYCDFSAFTDYHPYGHDYNWPRRGLPFQDIEGIDSIEDITDPANEERLFEVLNERCSRGDTPMNLAITALMANAYLLTGDQRYREWVTEYTEAWIERTRENDGIVPDNVGQSGEIGEYIDGKWYGGFYGWTWSGWSIVSDPLAVAAENAMLLEGGDRDYLELVRSTFDTLIEHAIERRADGGPQRTLYVPHKYGDPGDYRYKPGSALTDGEGNVRFEDGWFSFQPMGASVPTHLWYASMDDADVERIRRIRNWNSREWERLRPRFGKRMGGQDQGFVAYLNGELPDYPERILELDRYQVTRRLRNVRDDDEDPAAYGDNYLQQRNPIAEEGLVQLTMGAPRQVYNGGLLMARVRHFDPARGRPGLPPAVAALVDGVAADRTTFQLVNLGAEYRDVIVQAGAYAEHDFGDVRYGALDASDGQETVNDSRLRVTLPPQSRIAVDADTDRFANDPSYAFPPAVSSK